MSITTSYTSAVSTPATRVNISTAGDQLAPVTVVRGDGTGVMFYVDSSVVGGRVLGRNLDANGIPTGSEIVVSPSATGVPGKSVGATLLSNGNIAVTWIDISGNVQYRLYDTAMSPVTGVTSAETNSMPASNIDIAATATGFNIAWQGTFAPDDQDVIFRRFDNAGAGLDPALGININPNSDNDIDPSIAVLNDGKFVIAWHRLDNVTGNTAIYQTIRNADGTAFTPVALFDNFGTENRNVDAVALSGGGYALTFTDSGWGTGADLSTARFSATGTFIDWLQTGNTNSASVTLGTPSTDISSFGYVFGTYNVNNSFQTGSFLTTPDGATLLLNGGVIGNNVGAYATVQWIDSSRVLVAESSVQAPPVGDGSGQAVTSTVIEIRRITNGDSANDNYTAPLDGLNDIINGGDGNDSLNGSNGRDVIIGGTGDDVLQGSFDSDYLIGGAGNDSLWGEVDAIDTLQGGTGDDSYLVFLAGTSTLEFADEGRDLVSAYVPVHALQANVEDLAFGYDGSVVGVGNALDNNIVGYLHYDELFGGDGNDTLDGNTGPANALLGGAGNDLYLVTAVGDSTIELPGQGLDEVRTAFGIYGLQANVENLRFLNNADHQAGVGNVLDNSIFGGTGADGLFGREGNDTLYGGLGAANTLLGQEGDDTYYVDAVGDSVIEFAGQGTDLVITINPSFTLGDNVENLQYQGGSPFIGVGNALDNSITGASGADTLNGLGGNDILYNTPGAADVLIGGAGDDIFFVASAATSVVENVGEGSDSVIADVFSYTLPANVENLILNIAAASVGVGNALNNTIDGNSGGDTLSGLDGNDTLTGGDSADTLIGGNGADRFVYLGGETGVDSIVGFTPGTDDFYLRTSGFTPTATRDFVQGAAPVSANSTVFYNPATGIVSYDDDGTGPTVAIALASIGTGLTLTTGDVVFY